MVPHSNIDCEVLFCNNCKRAYVNQVLLNNYKNLAIVNKTLLKDDALE